MKNYFRAIQFFQKVSLGISLLILFTLPLVLVFYPENLSQETTLRLYDISHFAVFFVMIIRPLADIFTTSTKIRPLVILRKGVGVLSASIVVSFILAKIITDAPGYFGSLITTAYWSFENLAILAHLGDLSAILLIVTSNNFSKRILGAWWKRIQRLSYVYFYASSVYVFLLFHDNVVLVSMSLVTAITYLAYVKNKEKKIHNFQTV